MKETERIVHMNIPMLLSERNEISRKAKLAGVGRYQYVRDMSIHGKIQRKKA